MRLGRRESSMKCLINALPAVVLGVVTGSVLFGGVAFLWYSTAMAQPAMGPAYDSSALGLWLFCICLIPTLGGSTAAAIAAPRRLTLAVGLTVVPLLLGLSVWLLRGFLNSIEPGVTIGLILLAAAISLVGVRLATKVARRCAGLSLGLCSGKGDAAS